MRCEVGLIIEWEKSEGSDGSDIQTVEDVMEYIQNTIESNALFDHIKMLVENSGATELDNYEE